MFVEASITDKIRVSTPRAHSQTIFLQRDLIVCCTPQKDVPKTETLFKSEAFISIEIQMEMDGVILNAIRLVMTNAPFLVHRTGTLAEKPSRTRLPLLHHFAGEESGK